MDIAVKNHSIVSGAKNKSIAKRKLKDLSKSYKTKYGQYIKFGAIKYVTLDKINVNELNRDKDHKHLLLMKDKIMEKDFIDTIKLFPQNSDGTYDTAEGNHRVYALREIFLEKDWSSIEVPIILLPNPEYDSHQKENVIETIISYNKDNKPWTMYDYVSRWAKIPSKKGYQSMMKDMGQYQKNSTFAGISHVQICSIYTGEKSSYKSIKDGSYTLKHEVYKDIILENVIDWVTRYGISKRAGIFPAYSQNCVVWLWAKYRDMKQKDFGSEVQRIDYFEKLLEYLSSYHEDMLNRVQKLEKKAKTKTQELSQQNPLETDTKLCIRQLDGQLELFFDETFDYTELVDFDNNNIMRFAS